MNKKTTNVGKARTSYPGCAAKGPVALSEGGTAAHYKGVFEKKSAVNNPLVYKKYEPSPCAVSMLELTEKTCRWPIGDPSTAEFHFCGRGKAAPGEPYCIQHEALAYARPIDD